ncbi:sugar phosphate isomerase/epimerase family protein [Oryzicola mucosus]|uniref:Sugar phosphate isomerase/epimerase n=1 Tax=Oryzicola mucosus TaxID=2767425 RepID=A0A8J6U9I8_9HYPH|nr:sugar phosphate isomerase/epimerase family protein [Oryzicola mucosus]MBD0417357.1 sugar phosphate isomerase/epimerase [Oryzicola mucosus]
MNNVGKTEGKSHWALPYALHMGIRSPETPLFRATLGTADPLAHIDHAATLGLSGIADNMLRLRSPAMQAEMGRKLRDHGLRFGSFVVSPADWPRLWWGRDDTSNADLIRREIASCIAAAARVGAEVLTITSMIDGGMPAERQLDTMARHLADVIPMVANAGLRLGLETVSAHRVPDQMLRHLCQAQSIIDQVDHPNLGLVFDTHHVRAMDGDVLAAVEHHTSRIFIIQIADYPDRFEPGTGDVDFPRVLASLRKRCPGILVEWEFYPSGEGASAERACVEVMEKLDAAISKAS